MRTVAIAAVALGLALPLTAAAQRVEGIVLDDATGAPISGAAVVLLDASEREAARAEADGIGAFALAAPAPGRYRVWATRIGYESVVSDPLALAVEPLSVEIRLRPVPVTLSPLEVVTEAHRLSLVNRGFYRRRELGIGRFLTADDVELRQATRVSDALRTQPGVRALMDAAGDGGSGTAIVFRGAVRGMATGGGRPCLPTLVIDDVKVRTSGPLPNPARPSSGEDPYPVRLDQLVHPSEIAGIELYPSGAGVPVQWSGTEARCGVLMVWTKRREP